MSGLTPEAARAAAEWLNTQNVRAGIHTIDALRAEADRLEAAAKTPGQVLAEDLGSNGWPGWPPERRARYERIAAAVIAHHVGPDRVVVDRADVEEVLRWTIGAPITRRLREALS